ncbi:MAG: FKBP-type peptidyl-prolyl cis-trans isomerase [Saprospiraceae bacterium]|nr:FKBP-type peptidyl-prolyl cis-trans isomerase [Saprospiraceae bacterium]MBK8885742.1 FKBP-type peptidyl-prolyl cis-trans isomerase [Saprospiraceae bacterium]MBK9581574.1 FKBP-type peptidyl-prolyl cis-trans isomerase [Saprospiraceae bacterium]MBP6539130.1 FKBP-type peptidyl-prolyl cis-trans isomerase [Saprospiraceae bacterium]HQV65219.1 FKBP-type peptidyl-prolyl cis-trans isomerase [Saprospiraceae bacterium]
MKHLFFILTCTMTLGFLSCTSDEEAAAKQFETDIQLIENYLKEKNLTAEKTPQGVYYIINEPGGEEKPKITNEIKIKYSGYFLDGEVFDSSNESQYIHLFNFIQGWQIGIPKFGIGGKGKLLIPSKLAYGSASTPGRANAVLVFDIELINFK